MFGETMTRPMSVTAPTVRPDMMPAVLKRKLYKPDQLQEVLQRVAADEKLPWKHSFILTTIH